MSINEDALLVDIGERRIIDEILGPRYRGVRQWGDDAAFVDDVANLGTTVVATTDPCPPPMAEQLGFDDPYYTGWLLGTINLSDLAAAGARPVGVLSSLILPPETPLASFERLLDGLDACCTRAGTRVVGGNLKEASVASFNGTAIGTCRGTPLSRHGGRPGDAVLSIGELGSFWAGVLALRAELIGLSADEALLRNVLLPVAQTAAMELVGERGLAHAAIDTSDGVNPALIQLARSSGVRIVLDADAWVYPADVIDAAESLGVDTFRLAQGWGDWQVIVLCDPANEDEIRSLANPMQVVRLGEVVDGSGVHIRVGGDVHQLAPLESERFVRDSWFSAGVDGYIDALLNRPLFPD
jgi:thiamine-monophosphate kinase